MLTKLLPYVLAVAGVVGVFAGGYNHGANVTDSAWQSKWDQQARELAEAKADALEVARNEEQRRIQAVEDIANESKKQIEQAQADADAANATADSLRKQAKRLAATSGQCTSHTTATNRGQTGAATLLADLFEMADAEAGRMAAAYDRARAKGLACEASYDAVRNARAMP